MKVSRSLVLIAGVILMVIGVYLLTKKQLFPKARTIEKLTVAMVDYPPLALVYIAKNKGYFEEEGLEVTYKVFPRGVDSLTDALNGNSDIGLANETPVVRKIYEGENLRIITTLHTSTKNTAIIGRKDRNIFTANDLKGKKIGVTKSASYEFFLYSFLLSQGIELDDVTYVDGDLNAMSALLKSGEVDAVATGNIYRYDAEKAFPQDSLTVFESNIYTENSVVAGREDVIIEKKEAILRFLRALSKAEDFYKTNNQEALNAVVAELPTVSEVGIRDTWSKFTPVLKLDNVLLTILSREGQWFRDNEIYQTDVPDFRSAIFTDYLRSMKLESVTLY